MKYDMVLGHESTFFLGNLTPTIYVFSDHANPVIGSSEFNTSCSGRTGHLVYKYRRFQWTYCVMAHLYQWLRMIDDTATTEDIMALAHRVLDPVDLLRVYSEVDGKTWTATDSDAGYSNILEET